MSSGFLKYFVAQQGQDLYFFYLSGDSLLYRAWHKGQYLPEATLHTEVESFHVSQQTGQIQITCDTKGERLLLTYRNGAWRSRVAAVLPGSIYTGHNADGDFCLFKRADDSEEEAIDLFLPLSFAPYVAQPTGPNHTILFYQRAVEGCQVGYREITPTRTGPFHRFLNISGTLADASFLTTTDEVHLLMTVKTAFSHQLLYRKKTDDVFTPPILLWESPIIEQCLLTIINNELHATCVVGGKLYLASSADNGDSFSPMTPYKRKFCAEPVKAGFTAYPPTGGWFAREVYVDRHAPWDIQMLPDLYPEIYSYAESAEILDLKDNLAVAQQAIEAKDRQIMALMLQNREGSAQ